MKHPHQIRILMADDHPLILQSLRSVVEHDPKMKIVGQALNGKEMLDLARKLQPDVILTDIVMPGISGIQATKILNAELPHIGIIALSMVEKEKLIIEMLEAGAKGYLLKSDPVDEIGVAINAVYNNKTYFSKDVVTSVIQSIRLGTYKNKQWEFSEIDLSIIKLLCQEKSNGEIADILHMSSRTVEWHRVKILQKIGARNLAGIIVYAMRNEIHQ